jgi:hypothetical protein
LGGRGTRIIGRGGGVEGFEGGGGSRRLGTEGREGTRGLEELARLLKNHLHFDVLIVVALQTLVVGVDLEKLALKGLQAGLELIQVLDLGVEGRQRRKRKRGERRGEENGARRNENITDGLW